jgi:serine/threonine protein kinase
MQSSNNELDSEVLVFISKISAGAFGEVWRGTHKGKSVAIKKMKFEVRPKDQLVFVQGMIDEAKIMKEMCHERVVRFIGFDIKSFSIIMELMPRGSLSSFMEGNKKTMRWSTRYQMMLDICEGMAFLHSPTHEDGTEKQELFHQDLKSANIMLVAEGGLIRAKIGDFGLSFLKKSDDATEEVKYNGGTQCYQASVSLTQISKRLYIGTLLSTRKVYKESRRLCRRDHIPRTHLPLLSRNTIRSPLAPYSSKLASAIVKGNTKDEFS